MDELADDDNSLGWKLPQGWIYTPTSLDNSPLPTSGIIFLDEINRSIDSK